MAAVPPPPCYACAKPCNSKMPMIACSGQCSQSYHFACVNLPVDLKDIFKSTPGLMWKCNICRRIVNSLESKIDKMQESILRVMNNKLLEIDEKYQSKIETMRSELESQIVRSLNAGATNPRSNEEIKVSYAQVTSAASTTRLIIQPKIREQNIDATKAEIMQKVDPVGRGIIVRGVKPAKDGGLILGCENAEETKKLYSVVQQELSENYTVREMQGIMPTVQIVGLTQKLDNNIVTQYLRGQNEHIFSSKSTCEVIKVQPLKNKPSIYSVKVKVDVNAYKKLLDQKHVLLGLDSCTVYDGFTLIRCYCCNDFNHIASRCTEKNKPICCKCSGNHSSNQCESDRQSFRCSNCIRSNESKNTNFDINHTAFDYLNCSYYKMYQEKMKRILFGDINNK